MELRPTNDAPETLEELREDNKALRELNARVADMYVAQADRLAAAARQYMAYGWNACAAHLRDSGAIAELLKVSTVEENPFTDYEAEDD